MFQIKEFDSDITEYNIYVPDNVTEIYLTSKFENATIKLNNAPAANGVRKKISLTEKITKVEIILTPLSGNTLGSNTYTINVEKFCGTKTEVSNDKKSFSVTPVNIEIGSTIILALYEGEKIVDVQTAIYVGEPLNFKSEKAYTDAKVMAIKDVLTLMPIGDAEIVK